MFDVLHAESAARGELVQSITGIPYFYRQFGYEMALSLGGGRVCYPPSIPVLKEGQAEPFTLRPPTEHDLGFVMDLDRQSNAESLVSMVRDERLWRFELFERLPGNANAVTWRILQTPAAEPIGLAGFYGFPWGGNRLGVVWFELAPGRSYVETAASVLRGLKVEGEQVMASRGKPFGGLYVALNEGHPFYEVNFDRLPHVRPSYAWYIRVPDLVGFTRTIAPALEERLARSWAAGHTGELKLSLYRTGMRMVLERGRFAAIEFWQPATHTDEGHAGFPGLTFLQLLFGYRSFAELRAAFPDAWAENDETRGLITALFPRQRSKFIPLS
jgi:hypothetical protein